MVVVTSIFSSMLAIPALMGHETLVQLAGTIPFGSVSVKIDALSAWFILAINFTMITGSIYGLNYMKPYSEQKANLSMHWLAYVILHISLILICSVQNAMVFLICWESMALSAFILVIFEHYKADTLKAGINYLIQSHVSIIFLMVGFIYVAVKTNSYDFNAIAEFSHQQSAMAGTVLFLSFFIGFAIKAGFVPFHTWLPHAHPVAPSHVSGIMSGVVIKIGIYGILRMVLLINADYSTIGYIILFISIISGVYGVALAIIQHNLKKLLAYHSIENIGIIGIGIGIGCIGLGNGNEMMATLGFMGALLHTLNHSLFKSLLFYGAGNVYQSTHTMSIERLGGLIKQMPHTALLFLVASLAICGLPPLNGFISEFLIYGGIYDWILSAGLVSLIIVSFSILGLVLIGGLAIFCFTKAFSIVFLGTNRSKPEIKAHEMNFWQLVPMYMAGTFMLFIGLFPSVFLNLLEQPVGLFTKDNTFNPNLPQVGTIDSLQTINWVSVGFIGLIGAVWGLRKWMNRSRTVTIAPTWGCGYSVPSPKIQYTANSFVRTYTKLAKPVLFIEKEETEITGIFPSEKHYETHPYDNIERILIDLPFKKVAALREWFVFLQNGRLQRYILYGIVFIASVIVIPILIDHVMTFFHFLNHI
ncbi:MAG TPA: proton-conducting transporter membrane subunit [Prolixibacteraceae bacterium]